MANNPLIFTPAQKLFFIGKDNTSGFGKEMYMLSALHYVFDRARAIAAKYADDYNIFKEGDEPAAEQPRRRLTKLQIKALNDLGLDETALKQDVRRRYTQLVKQLHPDANKGDGTTEESFSRVVKAYKVLKTTDLG